MVASGRQVPGSTAGTHDSHDAADGEYDPDTPGDWESPAPDNVADALDELAAREGGAPGGGGPGPR